MELSLLDNREAPLVDEVAQCLNHSQEACVAVAFARQSARELLSGSLDKYVKKGRRLRFLAGTDFHLTELQLLDTISNPPTAVCKAYALPPGRQREFFHPKVYLFKGEDTATAIVGSSNFTAGGIRRNIEANIKIVGEPNDPTIGQICQFFDRQWRSPWARELTPDFRKHYNAAREARDRLETSLRTQPSVREPLSAFRRYIAGVMSQLSPQGGKKWLCVTSPANFWVCAGRGLWGDERWQRISELSPGDRLIFYIKGAFGIMGEAFVTGRPHESQQRPWMDRQYPFQVEIEMLYQLEEPVDYRQFRDRISVTRGLGSSWGVRLQTSMTGLTEEDYQLLHGALQAVYGEIVRIDETQRLEA